MNQEACPCQTSHTSLERQGQLVGVGRKKIRQKLLMLQLLLHLVPPAPTNCPWVSEDTGGMKIDCDSIDRNDDQRSKMKLIKCCKCS